MNNNYVVVKLISGETVMATFEGEDDKFVKIDYPVNIRTVIMPDMGREQVHASPLCPFSESTSFVLEKGHILFIKKLDPHFEKHYLNFIKAYEQLNHEGNDWEEEISDEMTVDELHDKIKRLDAMMRGDSPIEEQEEIPVRTFVQGNDTKH